MTTQTLVLIPGLGSDGTVWRRTMAELGDSIPCLVGDTLSDTTLTGMARRVLAQAPERFALAGVSMGGMVALQLIRMAPDRVSHLALVDTTASSDALGRKAYRILANLVLATSRDYRRLAERSLTSLVHPSTASDVRDELVEMSVRVGAKAYVRQNWAVLMRGDLRGIVPHIAVPTSVIVGEEDRMTPVARAQEIHKLAPGSTLHVIPNCGHLPPIERPDVVATLLRSLLER